MRQAISLLGARRLERLERLTRSEHAHTRSEAVDHEVVRSHTEVQLRKSHLQRSKVRELLRRHLSWEQEVKLNGDKIRAALQHARQRRRRHVCGGLVMDSYVEGRQLRQVRDLREENFDEVTVDDRQGVDGCEVLKGAGEDRASS